MEEKKEKYEPIKIKLTKEEGKEKDKKGRIVVSRSPRTNEVNYVRNDIIGLMALLRRFDTRIHPVKDWKMSIKVRSKVSEAYIKDLKEIELSIDEAAFLKLYLQELPEKEGKQEAIQEFELRTLFGVSEQLE